MYGISLYRQLNRRVPIKLRCFAAARMHDFVRLVYVGEFYARQLAWVARVARVQLARGHVARQPVAGSGHDAA